MQPLKLSVLGGLSITLGDQTVGNFVSRKVEALLVYLACERREHQRESLATLLWDDLTQERALGNLRTAISNLSEHLPDMLLITRQSIMLRPDVDLWLDLASLRNALSSAPPVLNAVSARDLADALDLYRGEFLAGFHLRSGEGFETWRTVEAERLSSQVLSALQRLMRYTLDHGQYEAGIAHARRALTIDSLSEEAHRSLILLLARSGQRGAALAQYEALVSLLRAELGAEPDAETVALLLRIQNEQIDTTPPKPIVHLPIPSTPFINRPAELGQITERLRQPDCRLLTIVGAGGMGKTRLALQAAADLADDFRDGVYFVALASVQQGDFLPVEIANALGFTPQHIDDPLIEVTAYLANRRVLLVMDNFEHLVEVSGSLSTLLSQAPEVRLLVTSREWLNLPEEWGLPIEGMAYPSDGAAVGTQYEAVQLFAACAQRVARDFDLAHSLDCVIEICRLVEGMPLSIELAASWLRVIPASEIAQHIDFKFLTSSSRGVVERHRSTEAVFDYSWKLLSDDEAQALMKLSVFKGAFGRESASKIAGATLPILASLLEKSLIRRVGEQAYSMHELLRQYTFERLTQHGEAVAARDAHLAHYVALTSDPDSRIHGEQQTRWLDRLESEHDNLRTAMSWAMEKSTPESRDLGLRLGASIWEFWLMRGHISEGRQWLGLLLDATQETISEARGAATQGAGYLAWIQGDSERAEALHQEGLAIRITINDKAGIGGSLSNLGIIAWSRGDFAAARDFYEQALVARREANYTLGVGSVLNNLSLLMQDQSLFTEAIDYAEQAWAIFKQLNDLQGMVHVLYNIGAMNYDRGDYERSREILEQALQLAQELRDQRLQGGLSLNLGLALISLGQYDAARSWLNESLTLMTQISDKQHIGLVKRALARLALQENRLDEGLSLIEESLSYLHQPKGDVYLGQALTTKGAIIRATGDLATANDIFREALRLLIKIKNPQPIAEALYYLGETTYQQGNLEQASLLIEAADAIALKFALRYPDHPAGVDRNALYSADGQGQPSDHFVASASLDAILDRVLKLID